MMMRITATRIVVGFLVALSALGTWADEAVWEEALEEDGIQVYLRDVSGSKFKEYRGVMYVEASLSCLVSLVEDKEAAPQWLHYCQEARILKRESDLVSYTYSVSGLPWPIRDRDMVFVNRLVQDDDTKAVTIFSEAVPDYVPEEPKLVRIRELRGFWKFTPQEDGGVEVVYQLHSEPGGGLPGWLANLGVVQQPFNTLKKMREYAKRSEYQTATLSYIQEP